MNEKKTSNILIFLWCILTNLLVYVDRYESFLIQDSTHRKMTKRSFPSIESYLLLERTYLLKKNILLYPVLKSFRYRKCRDLQQSKLNAESRLSNNNDHTSNHNFMEPKVKRFYIHIKYDGTNYDGWFPADSSRDLKSFKENVFQNQKIRTKKQLKQLKTNVKSGCKKVSIFQKLTNALTQVHEEGSLCDVDAFRRTEVGVHAEYQICFFDTLNCPFDGDLGRLTFALNRILPPEILISNISTLPYFSNIQTKKNKMQEKDHDKNSPHFIENDSFQFEYCYTINYSKIQDPMTRLYEWNRANASALQSKHHATGSLPLNVSYLRDIVEEQILYRNIPNISGTEKTKSPGKIYKFVILDKSENIKEADGTEESNYSEPWKGSKLSLVLRVNSSLTDSFLCQVIGTLIELGESLYMEEGNKEGKDQNAYHILRLKKELNSLLSNGFRSKDIDQNYAFAPFKGLILTKIFKEK